MRCILVSICFYFAEVAASGMLNNSPKTTYYLNPHTKRLSYLETTKENLLHQNWEENEKPCLELLLKIIHNVQNSTVWATWIWDSIQLPVGQLYGSRTHLGNYDECLDVPWKEHPEFRTQYCLAEIKLTEKDPEMKNVDILGSVKDLMQSKTKQGLKYNKLVWGLCTPAICKPESIAKFANALLSNSHLYQVDTPVNIKVNPEFCSISGKVKQRTFEDNLVLSFFALSTVTALLCTWYISVKGFKSKSTGLQYAKAFHINNNAKLLMETSDDCVGSVLGIRFISVFTAVGGHFWLVKNGLGFGNAAQLSKMLDTSLLAIILNVDMVVDTFFMISGLLLINGLMLNGVRPFNPLKVLAKRYIRFMWPIILILLLLPQAYTPTYPGPLAKKFFKTEQDACANTWWTILLMCGNWKDPVKLCYVILWSTICDYQMSIIGVIIYWIYTKNRRAGLQTFIIGAVVIVIASVIHGTAVNIPAVVKTDFRAGDSYRVLLKLHPGYTETHFRAGAYMVGMVFGFILSVFKPAKYRNVLSKKKSILAFISFLVMFTLLNVKALFYQERESSALENALFSVLRRILWAALVGYLIIICEYGNLSLVRGFLSWSVWVPLNKLSYGIYLTHFVVLNRLVTETRGPLRHDLLEDVIVSCGLTVVASLISLYTWIFLERPIINLIFSMFTRSKSIQENGNTENVQHTIIANVNNNGNLAKKLE